MPDRDPNWWRSFFEREGAVELSHFPSALETRREIAALPRLLQLGPDDAVLDVCCGPGRHVLGLALRGNPVVGLDIAHEMVRLTHQRLQVRKRPGEVVRGEAQRLPFRDAAFDHAIHLFNSFGYMETDEENYAVLPEIARCLRPGGRLLLETRNRDQQIATVPISFPLRLPDGRLGNMTCTWDPVRQRLTSRWSAADGSGRAVYYASIRLYTLDEWHRMFARAGLNVLGVYGDYEAKPFARMSRQLIFLCERGP